MKAKDLITGNPIEITVRPNADPYEIRQEIIRVSAKAWKKRTKGKPPLDEVRIFEKYALRFGMQKELKELDIL
jgi:hypothetical protein